jgi:hypothetical protein
VRLSKADAAPLPRPGPVETEAAAEIRRSLTVARVLPPPVLGMIAGAPGTGKTHALRRFAGDRPAACLLLTVRAGESRPFALAELIGRALGREARGHSLGGMAAWARRRAGGRAAAPAPGRCAPRRAGGLGVAGGAVRGGRGVGGAGGLHNLRAVVELARIFAGEEPVAATHVRAAAADMKLNVRA